MVKLTSNEEKMRKELLKFPQGILIRHLMNQLFMTKTPLYRTLNSLEEKGLAFRGAHFLWHPYPQTRIGNSDSSTSRLQESEQDKAQAITIMESCQALTGYHFSKDEWQSVLNVRDGKSMLDKAKALTTMVYRKALIG